MRHSIPPVRAAQASRRGARARAATATGALYPPISPKIGRMNDSAPKPVAAIGQDFVAALRGAAPYVHAHNGRVFVIAFGGEAALRPDFERLIYDVALLHSLGVKLVLVHGVRPQIEAQLAA